MVAPYWKYPSVLNGRIKPALVTPRDGEWVFVLGEESLVLPYHRLQDGDTISVTQAVDMTGTDLLRLRWKVDTGALPTTRTVVANAAATFKTSDMFGAGDGCVGVDVFSGLFTQADKGLTLRISDSNSNDGDLRIAAIPSSQSGYTISPAGRLAIFDVAPSPDVDAACTLKVLGLRWNASISIDGTAIFTFAEPANASSPWRHLAANVSKSTASLDLTFTLTLEQYE